MPPKLDNHKKALQFLKKDVVLKKLIEGVELKITQADSDLYRSLMRSVVSQQLSVKAAETIWQRFENLFSNKYPSIDAVLNQSDEALREVGLSKQKASYLKNIAAFFKENNHKLAHAHLLSDQDLIDLLVNIKGVGKWTVEMILMFSLKREDIFPIDDLGIVNGMCTLYKVKQSDKKKRNAKLISIAENWRPYRSLACFYIWQYKSIAPNDKQKKPVKKQALKHAK